MKNRPVPQRPADELLHFGRVVAEFQRGFGFVREQGQARGEVFAHVSILGWTPVLDEWMVYGIVPNPKNQEQHQVSWASKSVEEKEWLRNNLQTFENFALIALLQLNIITEFELVSILLERIDNDRTDKSFRQRMDFLTNIHKRYFSQFSFAFESILAHADFKEKLKFWSAYGSADTVTRYAQALGSAVLLNLWLNNSVEYYDFESYRLLIFTLEPDEQLFFLRKTFKLIADGVIQINAKQLGSVVRYSRTELISGSVPNYSVDLAITILASLADGGSMPGEQTIAEVVCRYVDESTTELGRFGPELFAPCLGRADKEKKNNPAGNKVIARIAGEEYPATSDKKIVVINGEELSVSSDGVEINGNWMPISWVVIPAYSYQPGANNLQHKPIGVSLCEGRLANVVDNDSQLPFWWCCNYPCFKPNQLATSTENWQRFTLIDFTHILNIEFSEDDYYAFVGLLNRVNRLLAHLKCRCCNQVLRPAVQSDFNFYRATRFACTNQQCEEKGKEVYLSHCLNGHCMTVVDSRDSKRCTYATDGFPNRQGMYICNICGGCCSKEALQRRKSNLERTHTLEALQNHFQYNYIKFNLAKRLYHWERMRIFCYNCAKPMNEFSTYYSCNDCKTRYNRSLTHIDFARKKNLAEAES